MRRTFTLALAMLSIALVSCSEESRDAIRSQVSGAIGSVSVSPSLPSLPSRSAGEEPSEEPTEEQTEAPSPTEEPTEEPTPEEPTEVTGPTGPSGPTEVTGPTGPTGGTEAAAPSGTAQAGTGFPWLWILVILALAGVGAAVLIRRSSAKKARGAWRTRARSVQTDSLALRDRVATELPLLRSGGDLMPTARSDVESSFATLGASLQQLQVDAPDATARTATEALFLAAEAVRSSFRLLHETGGDEEVRRGMAMTLEERLDAMDASIARFGASVDPDQMTRSGGAAGA